MRITDLIRRIKDLIQGVQHKPTLEIIEFDSGTYIVDSSKAEFVSEDELKNGTIPSQHRHAQRQYYPVCLLHLRNYVRYTLGSVGRRIACFILLYLGGKQHYHSVLYYRSLPAISSTREPANIRGERLFISFSASVSLLAISLSQPTCYTSQESM